MGIWIVFGVDWELVLGLSVWFVVTKLKKENYVSSKTTQGIMNILPVIGLR